MRGRGLLAAVAAAMAIAGCSSGGGSPTASSPAPTSAAASSSKPTSDTPSTPAPTSSSRPELTSLDQAAKSWLSLNRIAVELLLARKFAALRAIKGGHSAPGPCTALVDAAFNLDDRFPHFGTDLNKHPLIQALINASSKYSLAGNACNLYVSAGVRRDFAKGDELIRDAQREAHRLHARL